MVIQEKRIRLKNGLECILKSPEVTDAKQLLDYLRQTSSETDYMLRYPEEVTMSVADEEKYITLVRENPQNLMISAFIKDKLVGNCGISCVGSMKKVLHRATFGIAILKEAWNLGIGAALLAEILVYAKQAGYEQVELEVDSTNLKAIHLYERFGFERYGTRMNAFKYKDGTHSSEYLMMKRFE